MSKDKISDYSSTANSNTDIAGINIDEGCAPSGINDAIRTLMAQLKTWQSGGQDVYIHPAGSASAPSITANGDTNTGIFFPAADTVGISTGGTERARVDSSGNLGLGVTPTNAYSSTKSFEFQNGGIFPRSNETNYAYNATQDSGASWLYKTTAAASLFQTKAGNFAWLIAPSGTAGNSISFTQAMTLDASGRLLLGTTTAGSNQGLTVYNATQGEIRLQNSTTGNTASDGFQIAVSGSDALLYNRENANLVFGTNDTERARITSDGVLLVGTTTANGGLSGAGAINTIAGFGINRNLTDNSGRRNWAISTESLNIGDFTINSSTTNTGDPTTVRLQIRSDGSCYNGNGTWGSLSDAKIKENVIDATPKLGSLMQVRVVNYNRIGETRKEIGVIAQELEQIFPGMVDESEDLVDGQPTGTTTKAVKYSVFVPMLIKAIQELKAEFDAYKASHP